MWLPGIPTGAAPMTPRSKSTAQGISVHAKQAESGCFLGDKFTFWKLLIFGSKNTHRQYWGDWDSQGDRSSFPISIFIQLYHLKWLQEISHFLLTTFCLSPLRCQEVQEFQPWMKIIPASLFSGLYPERQLLVPYPNCLLAYLCRMLISPC